MRTAIFAALLLSVTPPGIPETPRWESLRADRGQVQGTAAFACRDAAGNLYVVGHVVNDIDEDLLLLKYSASGTLDSSFGRGGYQTWNGGLGHDRGTGVAVDASGFVYVSGFSSNGSNDDAVVLQFDAEGNLDLSFGTQGVFRHDGGGSDRTQGIALDAAGNLYVTGFVTGSDESVWVAKLGPSGVLQPGFGTYGAAGNDRGTGIALDAAGNVYVGGHNASDFLLLKYPPAGTAPSALTYDGGFDDRAYALAVTPAGEAALVGETANGLDRDVLVVKYDASTALSWAAPYDGFLDEIGMGAAIGASGEVYVAGYSSDFLIGGWNEDALLLKCQATGATLLATYDGGQRDRAYGVVVESSGNLTLVGRTRLDLLSLDDVLVVSYTPTGAVAATVSRSGNEIGYAAAFGPAGFLYVAGQTWNGFDFDAVTMKYQVDGTLDPTFGVRTFAGGGDDGAFGLAVDAEGNVYVGISTSNWGISWDMRVLKYTPAGAVDAAFDAVFSFSNQDGIGAVGLDPAGRIVVVGTRMSNTTGYSELFALGLDPASGALEWTQAHSNPAGWVYGNGLAFDSIGRIYLAGSSDNDALLVRLLPNGAFDAGFGAGGAVLYDAGGADWGSAVAVDAADRPILVGYAGTGADYDLIALRYDSVGALDPAFASSGLYTYSTSRFDFGYAVGIKADGGIVVAGETDSTWGLVSGDLLLMQLTPDGTFEEAATYDSGLGRDAAFGLAVGNGFAVCGTRGQAASWVMRFAPPDPEPATNGAIAQQDAPTSAGGGCAASLSGIARFPLSLLFGFLTILGLMRRTEGGRR